MERNANYWSLKLLAGEAALKLLAGTTAMKLLAGAAAVMIAVVVPKLLFAQDSSGVKCLGRYWHSNSNDLAVQGNYAYVADGAAGLRILDVHDPAEPTQVALLESLGYAERVVMGGFCAYVVRANHGIVAVNVRNPEGPAIVGDYAMPAVNALTFSYDKLYAYEPHGGLSVIDVSDPTSMCEISQLNLGIDHVTDIEVRGYFCYLAAGVQGLQVVLLLDLSNPEFLGSYSDGEYGVSFVEARGDTVYIIGNMWGNSRLSVLNVSRLDQISLSGTCDIEGASNGLDVRGFMAYVTGYGRNCLNIVNIGHPAHAEVVAVYATDFEGRSIGVTDNYAFVGGNHKALYVVDISNPNTPVEVSAFGDVGRMSTVKLVGDHAFVGSRVGIQIMDIGNPDEINPIGSIETHQPLKMDLDGGLLYSLSSSGLTIFDVNDIRNPRELGHSEYMDGVVSLRVSGDYAYIGSSTDFDDEHSAGLYVYDVSDPAMPRLVEHFDSTTKYLNVMCVGNYAYCSIQMSSDDFGLSILDVRDMASVHQVRFLPTRWPANDMKLMGENAILVNDSMFVYNLADPERPILRSCVPLPHGGTDIEFVGDYAVISEIDNGICVFNVANLDAPCEVGYYENGRRVDGLAVRDNLAYIAAEQEFGIYNFAASLPVIEKVSEVGPDKFEVMSAYPNPFNSATVLSYSLAERGAVRLGLYDLQGREVKRLLDFGQEAGTYRVTVESDGLAGGSYLAKLEAGGSVRSVKLVVEK